MSQELQETLVGARLRALYLLAIAVGVFFLPGWQLVAAVAAVQLAAWLLLKLGVAALMRQLRKLFLFCSVIFVAYALVSEDPATDEWRDLALVGGWVLEVNVHGAIVGLTMVLRVIAVVLASHVARAGDPRALARGLRGIGMPRAAALALDATLSLLGGGGGKGKGRGKGDGSGRGKGDGSGGGKSASGFVAGIKRLARGDIGALLDGIEKQVARAEAHLADDSDDEAQRELIRDVAIVSGIALTMLGIKALKLLPGLPFAPGHKGVLLIPLYIVAGFMTRSRFGASLTGLTMGSAAFLLGDGRWGLFEIAKHVAPGLLVDLLMPALILSRRHQSRAMWALLGLIIALGRFATVTAIALSVQAPALVFAFLIPGLLIHGVFGILSGLVTAPLVRALDQRGAKGATVPATSEMPSSDAQPGRGRGGGGGGGGGRGGGQGRGGGRNHGKKKQGHTDE